MGYFRAGFDVDGVDLEPQPNYPFAFYQGEALRWDPAGIALVYDAVHASPPCQVHSRTRSLHDNPKGHLDLIPETRDLLIATGLPYIIENVPDSPLLDPVQLCGSSFALPIRRHRLFESNVPIEGLSCDHEWQERHKPYIVHKSKARGGPRPTGVVSVHGAHQHSENGTTWSQAYNIQLASIALGIDWMKTKHELNQSIPPAYTYHLGKQLLKLL